MNGKKVKRLRREFAKILLSLDPRARPRRLSIGQVIHGVVPWSHPYMNLWRKYKRQEA